MNNSLSKKDKSDWKNFIDNKNKIEDKDSKEIKSKPNYKEQTIDLHGYSLDEANKLIHKFILFGYENNINKITVITGKGSGSKNKENPYQSENLGILKYSVPEYINSNSELLKIIKSINQEDIESVMKGSFDIFLKKNEKNNNR